MLLISSSEGTLLLFKNFSKQTSYFCNRKRPTKNFSTKKSHETINPHKKRKFHTMVNKDVISTSLHGFFVKQIAVGFNWSVSGMTGRFGSAKCARRNNTLRKANGSQESAESGWLNVDGADGSAS